MNSINEKKIAFFDSGVGGLTVFNELKKILPKENYLYFGDLKNIPYGAKSKDELLKIADEIFKYLETQDVKAVVMACNTTSANTYEELKDNYNFKIYPIIQSCAEVFAQMPVNKIGVFATEATIKSSAYARELKKYNAGLQVMEMSCPPWVRIVEDRLFDEPESIEIIKSYLARMLWNSPEKIILGCTHYPYLLDVLSKYAPRDIFIDPADVFARYIKSDLEKSNLVNQQGLGSEEFAVSANPERFQSAASMFYALKSQPKVVEL